MKVTIGSILVVMLFFVQFIPIHVLYIHINDQSYIIPSKQFEIAWIHSVEKEEWIEVYERKGKQLYIKETYFKTFGAGVPSEGKHTKTKDGFIHMDIQRELPELNLIVSHNVETSLHVNSQVYLLHDMVDDYEEIIFEVKRLNIWQYIRGERLE